MIRMTAPEVAQLGADGLGHLAELGENLLQRHRGDVRMVLHCGIEAADVSQMMAVVMDLHRLCVDVRGESGGGIKQRIELERTRGGWSRARSGCGLRVKQGGSRRHGSGERGRPGDEAATSDGHGSFLLLVGSGIPMIPPDCAGSTRCGPIPVHVLLINYPPRA